MLPSYLTLTLNEETGECVSWDLRIDKYNGVTYISIMSNSKAPCKGKSFVNCLVLKLLPFQGVWGKLGEVLFLFLLQLTLLNQMIQSEDFGILLFK